MVQIRRAFAGRHDETGHYWEHDGDVLDVEDGLASRLLAEPAAPVYTLVEPGATTDAKAPADVEAEGGKHEQRPADTKTTTAGDKKDDKATRTPITE